MVSSVWNIVRNGILWPIFFNQFVFQNILMILKYFHKKFKCELESKCVAYTFEKSKMTCILHSSTDHGTMKSPKQQTGVKKADFILSLPEISLCSDKNRRARCIREPRCRHINCLRNSQNPSAFIKRFSE